MSQADVLNTGGCGQFAGQRILCNQIQAAHNHADTIAATLLFGQSELELVFREQPGPNQALSYSVIRHVDATVFSL